MREPFDEPNIRIAVISGGTGSFTLLSVLKNYTTQIASIVNMADDGGSTGVLRDEFGVLPSGDIRQCLVALSDSPKMRDLFSYRFEEGLFGGHSFGNILLTALEKTTGSFSEAVETAADILRINGTVIPGTLDDIRLKMSWPERGVELDGEHIIDDKSFDFDPREAELSLIPNPAVNPTAIRAIEHADIVVIAPGDIYTSIGPLLVIPGVGDALRRTDAMTVYISNLVTKRGQTDGFTSQDHANEIERFAGGAFLDYVLYNQERPNTALLARYEKEHAFAVERGDESTAYEMIPGRFLGEIAEARAGDKIASLRAFIRHDADAVCQALLKLYRERG